MASFRRLARMCRNLAKQHVDDPDVPAAPGGAVKYAKWVQIALTLYRAELEKSLREPEDYLNEMPSILAVFELDESPLLVRFAGENRSTRCVNSAACSVLRRSRQAGVAKPRLTRVGSGAIRPATATARTTHSSR